MKHLVEIDNFAFRPSSLEIRSGDSVVWKNLDGTKHSAERDDAPKFDTGLLKTGEESKSVSFEGDGESIEYRCGPHPHMRGSIVILSSK